MKLIAAVMGDLELKSWTSQIWYNAANGSSPL